MRNRMGSLRMRLVLYVFFIMLLSNFLTSALYFSAQLFPGTPYAAMLLTQVLSPVRLVLISGIIATVITAWIGKYFLSPILQIKDATERVAKGDFSVKLPENEGEDSDEMNDLIRSFNRMTQELSGIEMFRNDFINSFSHEFKTPIVSIRGFARQLQREDLTDAERREYATIIADESERLASLATNILLLSKLEAQ